MKTYHVRVPYWFHARVQACSREEALEKFHSEAHARMGEHDDDNAEIEEEANQ
jgi:hypothetical protein